MIMVQITRLQVTARVINYAGLVIMQTLTAMKMAMKNKLLEQRAYTDVHTGLPNKGACEAPLRDQDTIVDPTVCIMAYGWAILTDEGTYTLQMLLDKADSDMYENKQLCKKRNLG